MPTNSSSSGSIHTAKFKAKAKSLLKAVQAREPNALSRIEPYFTDPVQFKLSQAQLVVARELQAKSWRELNARDDWLSCSFCKKWQYEYQQLIAGPDHVYVCNECVDICNQIIREAQSA